MYPLDDKDLYRLMREAAERYDLKSGAPDWESLEKRLDKELPVKEKDRRRFILWLFLIVLLAGTSLVYMLGTGPSEHYRQASHKPATGTTAKQGTKLEEKAAATTGADIAPGNNPSTASVPQSHTVSPGKETETIAKAADLQAKKQASVSNDVAKANNKQEKDKPLREAVVSHKQTEKQRTNAENQQKATGAAERETLDKPASEKAASTAIDSASKKSRATDSAFTDPANKTADKKPVATKAKQLPASKWEFGILTGPDFSNVGFRHSYKTGINIGAMVGYRISDRWLVNSGLIYTKKFYQVDGEEYYPPKHYWTQYVDLDYLKGYCSMFEIPVNIRYDAVKGINSRYFASTGLTSYIMNKQDYTYYYWRNGEYKDYRWATDSTFRHWASVVNFSFGVERSLGTRFSIQAEPYLKLPLAGVGFGKIKLNSYGLYVTFKYKPAARSKK